MATVDSKGILKTSRSDAEGVKQVKMDDESGSSTVRSVSGSTARKSSRTTTTTTTTRTTTSTTRSSSTRTASAPSRPPPPKSAPPKALPPKSPSSMKSTTTTSRESSTRLQSAQLKSKSSVSKAETSSLVENLVLDNDSRQTSSVQNKADFWKGVSDEQRQQDQQRQQRLRRSKRLETALSIDEAMERYEASVARASSVDRDRPAVNTHVKVEEKTAEWGQLNNEESKGNGPKFLDSALDGAVSNRVDFFTKVDDDTTNKLKARNRFRAQSADRDYQRMGELASFWNEAVSGEEQSSRSRRQRRMMHTAHSVEGQKYVRKKAAFWRGQQAEESRQEEEWSGPLAANKSKLREKQRMWQHTIDSNVMKSEKAKKAMSIRSNEDFGDENVDYNSVEALCEAIHEHGEQYRDGTAAIDFDKLFKYYKRPGRVSSLMKAKRHGLVFFEADILSECEQGYDDVLVLQKPIQEVRQAFQTVRKRHFQQQKIKKTQKIN